VWKAPAYTTGTCKVSQQYNSEYGDFSSVVAAPSRGSHPTACTSDRCPVTDFQVYGTINQLEFLVLTFIAGQPHVGRSDGSIGYFKHRVPCMLLHFETPRLGTI
jgi:hypothetical protein